MKQSEVRIKGIYQTRIQGVLCPVQVLEWVYEHNYNTSKRRVQTKFLVRRLGERRKRPPFMRTAAALHLK